MTKFFILLSVVFSLFIFVPAYANSVSITSGLPLESESTFDEYRVISGTAEDGSKVTISLENEDGGLLVYKIEVGVSAIFSQKASLSLGENFITVKVEKEGEASFKQSAIIKRKSKEIKRILEKERYIPEVNLSKPGEVYLR